MPKAERRRVIDLVVGFVLVAVNGLLALGVLGTQLSRFSWASEASAQTYYYYYYPTPSAVPAMSWFGMAALALFMAVVGIATLARRETQP